MQTVYLLLRANSQNGPFTLNELLQFDLTPYDLIWIEGKSAGWYYPQEIEALRPHLSFLQKPDASLADVFAQPVVTHQEAVAPKKIFVSMPSAVVAGEEVKQGAATMPLTNVEPTPPAFTSPVQLPTAGIKTAYTKPLEEAKTEYTARAYQKSPAKKPLFSKSGIAVLCLLSVALYATWRLANKPATEEVTPSLQQTVADAQPASAGPENSAAAEPLSAKKAAVPLAKKEKGTKNLIAVKNTPAVGAKPAKTSPVEVAATHSTKEAEDRQPAAVAKEEDKAATEEKNEPVPTPEAPKKKKLRDKILDIFRKKPEEKTEEARPAENDNGSRQSTRREAGSSLAQMVTVKFDIPNDWMMGVKGARATLTNKASETVVKAVVEIRYYNDDNDLLDRKTVVFANVKSRSTQTVSVPDHATATRLEYSVVSAVGVGNAVALR